MKNNKSNPRTVGPYVQTRKGKAQNDGKASPAVKNGYMDKPITKKIRKEKHNV